MPIVSAKCPNCGGELQLDDNLKTGFCMFCGSKIVIQEAIELKKVQVEGKVAVEGIAGLERMIQNGDQFMKLGEYETAYGVFTRICKEYPEDYRGWWGVVRSGTNDFTVSERDEKEPYRRYLDNTLKIAPGEIAKELKQRYFNWLAGIRRNELVDTITHNRANIEYFEKDINNYHSSLKSRRLKTFFWSINTSIDFWRALCFNIFIPNLVASINNTRFNIRSISYLQFYVRRLLLRC